MDGAGRSRMLAGRGSFTASCQAVDIGGSLSTVSGFGTSDVPGLSDRVMVRSTLIADAVAVAPVGDRVAIVKSGFPVEILSTLQSNDLPRPWDVTTRRGGVVTALGERELFVEDGLVIADGSGVVSRVPLTEATRIVAPRPDGTGAAIMVSQPGHDQILLVGDHGVESTHPQCLGPVIYVPGADYTRSLDAAEAQIPVTAGEAGFVDCRDGRAVSWGSGVELTDYDVGSSTGRIVTRMNGVTTVTTWTRGDRSSLRTTHGPSLPSDGETSFDPAGHTALTHPAGTRRLTVHRFDGERWREEVSLTSGLPAIAAAQVVDGGTLVLAISPDGGFELFDIATGRIVASDPSLASTYVPVTASFSARRVGDDLFVVLVRH